VISAILAQKKPTLSFEFFPPKDDQAAVTLWQSFESLLAAGADFASVTYGAGGSNPERSIEVVERMAKHLPTIGHLTAVGASRASNAKVVDRFESSGVASILALRGDAPKDNPGALEQGEFKTALQLIEATRVISSLEIGVAAFPDGHPESINIEQDARVLKLKQDAGAKYAITQLFFSIDAYLRLIETSSKAGADLPVLAGLMPFSNAKQVVRMAAMSQAPLPADLVEKLEAATDLDAAKIGMEFTVELGNRLLAAGAPGLHIFTLNQSKAALELASATGLVSPNQ
jgi:methylenetetrahydrofolate reductase (NADPH)